MQLKLKGCKLFIEEDHYMKLKTLRNYLRDIYQDGSACWTLHFSDQDCDYYTITDVYEDEDGDICLEAGDGYEHSAEELYDELRGYPNDAYVYVYAPDDDCLFDIEGGWYWDDDGDLTMDMHYNYYDDDDDDDDY